MTGRDPGVAVMRVLSWFLLVPGLGFLALGLGLGSSTQAFLGRAVETQAEVVRLVERRDDGVLFTPVFAFTTAGGRRMEVTHHTSTNPPAWRVGEQLVLLYDPARPERAAPRSWFALWLVPAIFSVLGAGLLVGVIVLRVAARKIEAGQK